MLRVSVQLRSEAGPETPVIAGGAAHTHNEGVRLSRPAVSHWVGGTWNTHLNGFFNYQFSIETNAPGGNVWGYLS